MTLRLIEGKSREGYYAIAGEKDFFPYEQIIKSGEEGPQLQPFFASLYNGPPYNITTRNMAVVGSLENPIRYSLPVPTNQVWSMANFLLLIEDDGAFDATGWGNDQADGLTNGLKVGLTIDGKEYDYTPIPWYNHTDVAAIGGRLEYHDWGIGPNFLTLYIRLSSMINTRVRMDGSRGDTFWIDVRDDLSYLVVQRCMCNGIIEGVYL